ncbi:MAG: hypothetical protein H2174_07845 [Vampirovibrio sp.]|nr:hypothetical protein [Vampirovibrio sp.]
MQINHPLFSLTFSFLLLWGQLAYAEPPKPQTEGWQDIYLTYNRICKKCTMTDNQDGTVYMVNQQGIGASYPAHEVLGVDYHPLERKFRRHLATTLNPAAAKTLMPYSLEPPVHQD